MLSYMRHECVPCTLVTQKEIWMQRLVQKIAVFVFVVLVSTPLLVAVDSQSPRQVLAADYGWKFFLGDPSGAEAPSFADVSWRAVDLPHDWWKRRVFPGRYWLVSQDIQRPG